VKSQTLEAEFAETKAQLEELKGRQKQLEIRNTLLEKVTQFNQQQPQQPPLEDKDQVNAHAKCHVPPCLSSPGLPSCWPALVTQSTTCLAQEEKEKKTTSFGQPTSLIARGRASATLPNVIHLCQTKCQ